MTTAYITHPDCLRHEMGAGHPENPERLNAVNEHMKSSGLLAELRSLRRLEFLFSELNRYLVDLPSVERHPSHIEG